MKKRLFALAVILTSTTALLVLLSLMGGASSGIPGLALAALLAAAPTVTGVDPTSAPNDLDTPIVITGTGFTAGATVQLDDTSLDDVGWVNSTKLTATVPWGLDSGVYTVTVVNPGEGSYSLTDAFTVTEGIDVWTTGGPYGGWVWNVTLHPVTPTWVYASATSSGLFFSADSAAHWQLMLLSAYSTGCPSFDPQMPETMYVSDGVFFRTRDGGHTWEDIMPPNPFLQAFYAVAHPISSGVVYAGASASLQGPIAPGEEGGIYRSEDWGDTWMTTTQGLTDTHVTVITFHPEDPSIMLAGTRNGHLFTSTNGGGDWNWVARLSPYVVRLYFNPFGAHEAWAITASPWMSEDPPSIYKSLDPGLTTWQSVSEDFVAFSLAFHPTISGTLWASGGSGYVSTDGGETWSPLESGPPGGVLDLAIDPIKPNVMYAGTCHYGAFKSTDGGNTWAEANQGLAGIVPDYLAVSPANPYEVYAYAQTLGLLKSNNGGDSWRSLDVLRNGFGSAQQNPLAVDPFTPTRVYLGEGWSPDPLEEATPSVRISEDGGHSWHVITLTMPSVLGEWGGNISAVAPHPTISGRILAGAIFFPPDWTFIGLPSGGIYTSDDYGEHWVHLGPSQPVSGVVDIAYNPADPQIIYAATRGTGLLKSSNGGLTWQTLLSSLWSESQDIHSVAIHPQDPNTLYVSELGSVYVSRNGGETWTYLPLPLYVQRLLFAPTEPATLYAGGGSGLYRSTDGQTWEQAPGVPPDAGVNGLAAGRDEERVVVYIGSSGGTISLEAQATSELGLAEEGSDIVPGLGRVMGGGVYRMTTRLHNPPVYLPLVLKEYAP